MQYVEEHCIADTGIRATTSVCQEVPFFENDVRKPGLKDLIGCSVDHFGFDVQREESPSDKRGRRYGERSVPAPKLDDITARTRAVQPLKDSTGVEELCPEYLVRHSTFSSFHLF